AVPVEDVRELERLRRRVEVDVALLVTKLARLALELLVQPLGSERLARQLRAAARRAVERHVHARVLERRPDDLLLQRVERDRFAADHEAALEELELAVL